MKNPNRGHPMGLLFGEYTTAVKYLQTVDSGMRIKKSLPGSQTKIRE